MNEISWTSLGKNTNIDLWRMLNYADIETFKKSERIFENFEISYDICRHKEILKQLNLIPSFKMQEISFDLYGISKLQNIIKICKDISQRYNIKHFKFNVIVRDDYMEILNSIYSNFPKSKTSFEICVGPISKSDFDELNRIFLEPNKVSLNKSCQLNEINKEIYNVKSLKVFNNYRGLENFKRLENLCLNCDIDLKAFKKIVLNNKQSLKEIELNIPIEDWDFEIRCQLKSFKSSQKFSTKLLTNQRNLRHCFLFESDISSEILEILSKNIFLSTINFKYCCLKNVSFEDFKFLEVCSEICFVENYVDEYTFLNSILYNIKKVNWLYFDVNSISKDNKILNTSKKLLENLKILKINGTEISEYVSSRISCPNLEVCDIDFFPEFIFNCIHLGNLTIGVEIGYIEIVNILENIKSLETFHFHVHSQSFLDSLKYIFGNIRNIQHFKLVTEEGEGIDENILSIVEEMLTKFQFKWEKTDLMYFTETFSFVIWIC